MTDQRKDNREWLEKESARRTDGWEAWMLNAYGMEGALDLLAAQDGRPHEINLTHRPFSHDPELKRLVYEAREAESKLARRASEVWWAESEKERQAKAAAKEQQ